MATYQYNFLFNVTIEEEDITLLIADAKAAYETEYGDDDYDWLFGAHLEPIERIENAIHELFFASNPGAPGMPGYVYWDETAHSFRRLPAEEPPYSPEPQQVYWDDTHQLCRPAPPHGLDPSF